MQFKRGKNNWLKWKNWVIQQKKQLTIVVAQAEINAWVDNLMTKIESNLMLLSILVSITIRNSRNYSLTLNRHSCLPCVLRSPTQPWCESHCVTLRWEGIGSIFFSGLREQISRKRKRIINIRSKGKDRIRM